MRRRARVADLRRADSKEVPRGVRGLAIDNYDLQMRELLGPTASTISRQLV
jgi:hypothetical protein